MLLGNFQKNIAGILCISGPKCLLAFGMFLAFVLMSKNSIAQQENTYPETLHADFPKPDNMVLIPAGEFLMGLDPARGEAYCKTQINKQMYDTFIYFGQLITNQIYCKSMADEGPEHKVMLDVYYIDKYEVIQKDFETIAGHNPSQFKGPNLPVEKVNWYEANSYCKKIGKRLPTEAEWEKAIKGGYDTTLFYWGDAFDSRYAFTSPFSAGRTHIGGQKKPNKFGLYDMSGNVSEWVADWYSPSYYKESPYKNPKGPKTGSNKVFRGGSWRYPHWFSRSSVRFDRLPVNRHRKGFRCAKNLD